MHVFCELEGQIIGNVDDFILKVRMQTIACQYK